MQRALELAMESFDDEEVPVGAVIVKDKKIIGEGKNKVISENDILIFLDGTAENGNFNSKADLVLENLFVYSHYDLMDKYLFTLPLTFKTLPIFQISKIFKNKNKNELFNDNFEEIFKKDRVSDNETVLVKMLGYTINVDGYLIISMKNALNENLKN